MAGPAVLGTINLSKTLPSSVLLRMAAFARLPKLALAAGTVGAATLAWGVVQEPQQARNWHSNAHLKYPASANFPDLSKHNNHMADALTPAVSLQC